MKHYRHLSLAILFLMMSLAVHAQRYANDFENQYTWYPPWSNIHILSDSIAPDNRYVCRCEPAMEFGLGFSYTIPDSLAGKNFHLDFKADYRFPDTIVSGEIVITIKGSDGYRYWQSHPLSDDANNSAAWFPVHIELNIPADYLAGSTINTYLWNNNQNDILIDNAVMQLTPWVMPSYLPRIDIPQELPTDDDLCLYQPGDSLNPLTYPIGVVTEYILHGDTVTEYQRFKKTTHETFPYQAISSIDTTYAAWVTDFQDPFLIEHSSFYREAKLLRKALVVPFIDSTLTIYRRNMDIDTSLFQTEYYLDREGFQVGKGERSIISYHQKYISSTQFDADHRVAYFNLDYWRDHPMIHYPLSDTLDHFEDISYRAIEPGMKWHNFVFLHIGDDVPNLPRIMSIPYGYESGIIFTEHADWTDIRTHRAILFGSEKITKAKDATGGFVYYGIPVTKSVFYNNPDGITNEKISNGTFKGLHSTIKTDREFKKLLKQLHKVGFDICLHTPEQYTTTPKNLKEALDYMQRKFKSTTWIDHGYNNDLIHNREDMVCDGLNPTSEYYAAELWWKHGVTYLWNAYYEENRMEQWCFDNNLIQPYYGFGDALPNRQITTIAGFDKSHFAGLAPSFDPEFLTWSTPSTLDITSDSDWDYYYSSERLQRIVDNRHVHITHAYPAWVWPGRTFWTYDEDSTIVALPGMNRAFERIAALRDEHKLLPMTVKTYLDHYSGLLQVDYQIIDSNHICLTNYGKEIKGFTLWCPSPIRFEDNRYYEFRKSGNHYYIWFDLKSEEKLIISF